MSERPDRIPPTTERWPAGILLAFTGVHVFFDVHVWLTGPVSPTALGPGAPSWQVLVGIPALVISGLLLVKAGGRRDAIALAALVLLITLVHTGMGYFRPSLQGEVVRALTAAGVPNAVVVPSVGNPTPWAVWLSVAALLWFSAEFPPTGDRPEPSPLPWTARPLPVFATGAAAFAAWAAVDAVFWTDQAQLIRILGGAAYFLFFLGAAAALGLSAHRLWENYRRADRDGRRRALWVFLGVESAAVLVFLTLLADLFFGLPAAVAAGVFTAVPLLLLTGVAVGAFYSGAFDPSLAVRKTTVYGALGLLIALILGVVEEVISAGLTERFGLPDATGVWAGALLSVAVLGPLHARLDALVSPPGEPEEDP